VQYNFFRIPPFERAMAIKPIRRHDLAKPRAETPAEAWVDLGRIEAAVAEIIEAIGEDPSREGLRETPARVARMYAELFEGLRIDPREFLSVSFDECHEEMVILRDIPFYSVCEHHFMPFHGAAAVGYIPDGRVVGVSKMARLVEGYARRPQLQERLTTQVADALMETLEPDGVAVVIEAEHLCMTQRGIKKPGSRMVTSATRGTFRKNDVTRAEFLSLVRGS
jgi:GTP cyclohydrolase I